MRRDVAVLPGALGLACALLAGCSHEPVPEPERDVSRDESVFADSMLPSPPPVLRQDTAAQPGIVLLPIDEAPRGLDFLVFRDSLIAAVARRDSAALMAVIDPAIKFSFGDDHGSAGFRRVWFGLDAPGDLWLELGSVIALGGAFATDSQFIAPFTSTNWPQELDPFEHMAVVDSGTVVRGKPSIDAAPLGTLGWQIVRVLQGGPDHDPTWVMIDRGSSAPGFVAAEALRSPVSYRAFFERRSGLWRMTMFLAGD